MSVIVSGVDAREGINTSLHALLALVFCFTILLLFIVVVNVIFRRCGKKQRPELKEEQLPGTPHVWRNLPVTRSYTTQKWTIILLVYLGRSAYDTLMSVSFSERVSVSRLSAPISQEPHVRNIVKFSTPVCGSDAKVSASGSERETGQASARFFSWSERIQNCEQVVGLASEISTAHNSQ